MAVSIEGGWKRKGLVERTMTRSDTILIVIPDGGMLLKYHEPSFGSSHPNRRAVVRKIRQTSLSRSCR